jgi:hypothetical protein
VVYIAVVKWRRIKGIEQLLQFAQPDFNDYFRLRRFVHGYLGVSPSSPFSRSFPISPSRGLLAIAFMLASNRLKLPSGRNLIGIKKRYRILKHHAPGTKGAYTMPTEIIVAALMAAAFGIFAVTLYWADLHTREVMR